MKYLILGGTGAMGVHLVNTLSLQHSVYVTTRKQQPPKQNTTYLIGNAKDKFFIEGVLSLHHWDAIIDFMIYTVPQFKERVSIFLNSTDHYIFLSSSRVYSNTDTPITENTPRLLDISKDDRFLKTDEYSLVKARQEDILSSSPKKNWTIIRPYITYDTNRLQLGVFEKEAWLYRALDKRTIVFSSEIAQKLTTMTSGKDVAKGIEAIVNNKKVTLGKIYNITESQSYSWDELLTIYLDVLEEHLGSRPNVVYEDLSNLLKYHTGKYQLYYDRLYNRTFNSSNLNNLINIDEFTNAKMGLANSLKRFLEKPSFKNINEKAEAVKDKLVGEHSNLANFKGIRKKLRYILYRYVF